jgi:hypothetical protein
MKTLQKLIPALIVALAAFASAASSKDAVNRQGYKGPPLPPKAALPCTVASLAEGAVAELKCGDATAEAVWTAAGCAGVFHGLTEVCAHKTIGGQVGSAAYRYRAGTTHKRIRIWCATGGAGTVSHGYEVQNGQQHTFRVDACSLDRATDLKNGHYD